MGSLTDWGLIDDDDFIDMFDTFDTVMSTNQEPTIMEVIHESVGEDIHDEG